MLDKQRKGSPYSIAAHRVPELIAVLGSQFASDMSHKPGNMLPLLSARPAVTRQTVHTHCAFVHQAAKLVAALLRVARVTSGLAESNGSILPGL